MYIFVFFDLLFLLFFSPKFVADTFWSTINQKLIKFQQLRVKISIYIWISEKINLHWFCTQNHILEPFSVRRVCTQCYVTSEPYPRPSQIWSQTVRETRKKIVIKCRGESFARCRVIARYVEGGGGRYPWPWPPPPSLFRVKKLQRKKIGF